MTTIATSVLASTRKRRRRLRSVTVATAAALGGLAAPWVIPTEATAGYSDFSDCHGGNIGTNGGWVRCQAASGSGSLQWRAYVACGPSAGGYGQWYSTPISAPNSSWAWCSSGTVTDVWVDEYAPGTGHRYTLVWT